MVSDYLDADYDKAAALAAAGTLPEAKAMFEAAARKDPGDAAVAAAVGIFRDRDSGRVSGDVVQRIFRAIEHGNEKRWKEAHADIDEIIRAVPDYPRAHSTRATLFIYQGPDQYPNAIDALDTALKIDPRFAEGFYNRGAVRSEMKEFDAAIADYTRAIELEPTIWYAYRNRGSAYTHQNNAQAAIADYTKALELRPREAETLFLRGVVQAAIGQWDTAMSDFTKVIELDAKHPVAHYNLGLGHQQKGDLDQAMTFYTKAIELDPTDPSPFINRGLIYANRKEFDRAIADYDHVLEIAPDLVIAHFNKARALDGAGRARDAATEYRAFIEKAGADNQLAAQAQQRLAALERPQ